MKNHLSRLVSISVFTISIILLTYSFITNAWSNIGQKRFIEWRTYKDAPIVGRLVESRQSGLFSHAGLLGYGDSTYFSNDSDLVTHQYDMYMINGTFHEFSTYNSVIGFQGILAGFFDQNTNFAGETNVFFFQFVTSLLSAVSLVLLAVWLRSEFGIVSAVFAIIFMLVSEWLTLFGGSIYWSLWAFYLPLIGAIYYFNRVKNIFSLKKLLILIYTTILIKLLFNGFEFITVTLIMVYIPFIYYLLKNRLNLKDNTNIILCIAMAELLAVLTALAILLYQNSIILGGFIKALEYIVYTLSKRSFGNPLSYSGELSQSLQSNLFYVLKQYLTGRAVLFSIKSHPLFSSIYWLPKNIEITYRDIFTLFFVVSMIYIFYLQRAQRTDQRLKVRSLIIVTWLSTIAPLSWYILFKAHSYLHLHLNFIIWQMPFTIFGFGMVGSIFNSLIKHKQTATSK